MKKAFMVLGIIFAVFLAIVVLVLAIFIPRTLKLDREATAYIQDAVPKIVANWNSQDLMDRATPELIATVKSRDNADKLFAMFKRLGELKHLDTPVGVVTTSAYSGTGVATIGNYTAQAQFSNGQASIRIQLLRVNDGWKINVFYIFSDAFMPSKT